MTFNHGVPSSNLGWVTKIANFFADVAELADALDLGSSVYTWGFKSLHPHHSLREWLSGRASPCQGERREFESRLPLQYNMYL